MIIDSHVHIGSTEKTKRSFTFASYKELMDKNNINSAIVMPNLSKERIFSELNRSFMEDYLSLDNREPFYPFILMDSHDQRTFEQVATYRREIYGVKYHPSISELEINSPMLLRYFERVREFNLLCLVHCGRDKKSHISHLTQVAEIFPSINFIAAHMGGSATDLSERAILHLEQTNSKNIYLDTSAGKLPWLIDNAVERLGVERIIFGSDEPYADIRVAKYLIDLANISTEAKEDILYKNIERILK